VGNSQLQHYLPQVFLKGFGTSNTHVWRYDRLDGSCKLLPVPVVAAENNLYSIQTGESVSHRIETELLGRLHGAFKPVLRKIERSVPLSHKDFSDLVTFVSFFQIRAPSQIRATELRYRQFNNMIEDLGPVTYHPAEETEERRADSRSERFSLATERQEHVSKKRGEVEERNEVLRVLVDVGRTLASSLANIQW
jgi:hypothetical protein